jgi:predicted O-methyltransferase YrrM
VFDLYTTVIQESTPYYAYADIEACRSKLLASADKIAVQDFGAGSKVNPSIHRKVKDIARYSLKSVPLAQLLFRLVNYFKPGVIFDLGTSLGITTLYLAAPCTKSQVYTFEGCPHTMAIAKKNFAKLGYSHISPVTGNINQTLQTTINKVTSLDFAFFDANHRLEPTLYYFHTCLSKAHMESVFVFDDIYWSKEMMNAWQQIKEHPQVMLTIDLFYMGLVFFRQYQPKQHFMLRF